MILKTVAELAQVDNPSWPFIEEMIRDAPISVEALAPTKGDKAFHSLQVTARSPLGGMALNSGGLLIENGWLRMYGAGSDLLPSIAEVNKFHDPYTQEPPSYWVIATDAIGGEFALNGGVLGESLWNVYYYGEENLEWEDLGCGYGDFLDASLGGASASLYEHLRWPGWEQDVQKLTPTQGFSFFPPLFTVEGQNPATSHRAVVPFAELLVEKNNAREFFASQQ